MIGHPGEARLLGFQDGTLGERSRRRIARHLADCQACRNIVQDQRGVRAALQIEAPAAPVGVLERAIATRASGAVIMLPVADPDLAPAASFRGHRRRGWSWRQGGIRAPRGLGASLLRIGTLAGATAAIGIVVLNLVASSPVFSLGLSSERWASLKQGVIDFDPLGFASVSHNGLSWSFERPMGPPAVLHPERLRPFTAVYLTHNYRQEDPAAAPLETGSTFRGFQLRLTPDRAILRIHDNSEFTHYSGIELDRATMMPTAWALMSRKGNEDEWGWSFDRVSRRMIEGGELVSNVSIENVRGEVPANLANPGPVMREALVRPPEATTTLDFPHLALQLRAVRLSEHWRGSFLSDAALTNTETRYWWTTSLEVDGSEVITVPAGTFDAWVLKAYNRYQALGSYHIAKSNGVVLRWTDESGRPVDAAVSYPGTWWVTELQSITYP